MSTERLALALVFPWSEPSSSVTQWAAVSAKREERSVAPHVCEPYRWSERRKGYSSGRVGAPPMIR
eukprot:scaffold287644_cov40-Tisochrysis_lutea.AAC.2